MKLGLGICKGKDFANTLGPWLVAPEEPVTLSAQGLGTLTNTVVAGAAPVALPKARPGRLRARAQP